MQRLGAVYQWFGGVVALTTSYQTLTAYSASQSFPSSGASFVVDTATGTLTAQTFDQIRSASLPLARAISNAFGYSDLQEFERQLAKTPISVQQLEDQLKRIAPAVSPFSSRIVPWPSTVRNGALFSKTVLITSSA